jgi:hypothetical protein
VTLEKEVHEGTLIVNAGFHDTISIDGRPLATGRFDGRLPSGTHVIRITSPGMKPHQREVIVADNQVRTVDVSLEPEAKSGVPAWAWVTGGALLAGGMVLGGYFLFRPAERDAPPPVAGTAPPGVVLLP